jgi:hypothetical protein
VIQNLNFKKREREQVALLLNVVGHIVGDLQVMRLDTFFLSENDIHFSPFSILFFILWFMNGSDL